MDRPTDASGRAGQEARLSLDLQALRTAHVHPQSVLAELTGAPTNLTTPVGARQLSRLRMVSRRRAALGSTRRSEEAAADAWRARLARPSRAEPRPRSPCIGHPQPRACSRA